MKTFTIDRNESEIAFSVKHMKISTVDGRFVDFNATMKSSKKDFSDAKIEFECNVNSINTKITERDNHLKSEEFFFTEKYPTMKFKSISMKKEADVYIVNGEMTIKDITRPLKLTGIHNILENNGENKKHKFELDGTLNRMDYNLKFNVMSGKGNSLISEEIKLKIHVQMIEQ